MPGTFQGPWQSEARIDSYQQIRESKQEVEKLCAIRDRTSEKNACHAWGLTRRLVGTVSLLPSHGSGSQRSVDVDRAR